MTQYLLDVLAGWGAVGLLIVMAVEGSSLPFPGFLLVLAYGYVLHPSTLELMAIAVAMSVIYSLFSYVPYGIGLKVDALIPKRFRRKLLKAKHIFRRYGQWSIALSRPFGIGNYISYVAGMCKVKPVQYGILTFVGVLPWAAAMLFLGKVFKGNGQAFIVYFQNYEWVLYTVLISIVFTYVAIKYIRHQGKGRSADDKRRTN